MTERGTLLPERSIAAAIGLPVFDGAREAIPRLREGLREFSSIFDGIGGGIARLERSVAGNWSLQFADGVRLVFRDDQERHVRRFAAVYLSALIGRRKSIERIDLRYPNGFAVQWRSGADAHSRVQDESGNEEELIAGLDIGTSKVVALVGEVADSGEVQLLGIGTDQSRGLKRGVVVDIENTVKSIRHAVEEAEVMAGSRSGRCTSAWRGGTSAA